MSVYKTIIGGASACQELNKHKLALNRTKSSAAMSVQVSQPMQVPACNISVVGTIFKNKLHLKHASYNILPKLNTSPKRVEPLYNFKTDSSPYFLGSVRV